MIEIAVNTVAVRSFVAYLFSVFVRKNKRAIIKTTTMVNAIPPIMIIHSHPFEQFFLLFPIY